MWEKLLANSSPQDLVSAITIPIAILGTYIAFQAVMQAVRARQTQAMLEILNFVPPELVNKVRTGLYGPYASGELTIEFIRRDINEYTELLWGLDRIGVLLYHGYVPHALLIDMFRRWPIRIWIILEDYIRDVRKTRSYYFQFFEYFAYVGLAELIKEWPLESLIIGEPTTEQRPIDILYLRGLLARMRDDLVRLRFSKRNVHKLAQVLKEDIYFY